MKTWAVYYENADTDEPRTYLGTIRAHTMAEALMLAAQYYEKPSHDLVVELLTADGEA